MEVWLDIATRFGVPVALLAIVLWYHAKVVAAKDGELQRVNELRVGESRAFADKTIERDEKWHALIAEVDKTLSTLSAHIR